MKFLGNMRLMTILKVTKKQDFNLFLENIELEKPQGGSTWPPSLLFVRQIHFDTPTNISPHK